MDGIKLQKTRSNLHGIYKTLVKVEGAQKVVGSHWSRTDFEASDWVKNCYIYPEWSGKKAE